MNKALKIVAVTLLLVMISCAGKQSKCRENESVETVKITPAFTEAVHQFDELYPFSEGMAAVRKDGKFGFINLKGELVIPCQYLCAGPFKEGLACVVKDEEDVKVSFTNKEGKLYKTKYPFNVQWYFGMLGNGYISPELISFKNGVCGIYYEEDNASKEHTVYINRQLREVGKPIEESAPIAKGIEYEVYTEPGKDIYGDDIELKGLKDKSGKIIIPAKYNNLKLSDNGVVLATLIVEDAESHLHPYKSFGLQIDGYVDFTGKSTFTDVDKGKLEGYKEAQIAVYRNLKQREEQEQKEKEEQARFEEERIKAETQHPENKFNKLLGNTSWRCLGYSWNGYYHTMKKEDAEFVVTFRPTNDFSGYASFVKWVGHNIHKNYAEKPSQDDYKYVIKGDIIELKNAYPEVEMSFKITYQDDAVILRSLDYVENGIFYPVTKSKKLFPYDFDI